MLIGRRYPVLIALATLVAAMALWVLGRQGDGPRHSGPRAHASAISAKISRGARPSLTAGPRAKADGVEASRGPAISARSRRPFVMRAVSVTVDQDDTPYDVDVEGGEVAPTGHHRVAVHVLPAAPASRGVARRQDPRRGDEVGGPAEPHDRLLRRPPIS